MHCHAHKTATLTPIQHTVPFRDDIVYEQPLIVVAKMAFLWKEQLFASMPMFVMPRQGITQKKSVKSRWDAWYFF